MHEDLVSWKDDKHLKLLGDTFVSPLYESALATHCVLKQPVTQIACYHLLGNKCQLFQVLEIIMWVDLHKVRHEHVTVTRHKTVFWTGSLQR